MKTSIISLFPTRFGASVGSNIPVRDPIQVTVPSLRIFRPLEKENLFNYATKANDSRWETLIFGALAASALGAVGVAFAVLV